MNKYIVIYHADAEALAGMQDATPEEMAEGMKPWMTWAENCGDGLIDMGTPLGGGLKLSSSGSSATSAAATSFPGNLPSEARMPLCRLTSEVTPAGVSSRMPIDSASGC